ncbi:MAG: ferrous iron transport protein B [Bacteroidota bacterium]
MSDSKKFLLVGCPNSGKTTLFNALTGLHQKTANYSGVTIEKYIGHFKIQNTLIELIDLPGIYSLYPDSDDEYLSVNEILNSNYDGVVLVLSAEQLHKSLLLALQVVDLKKPLIVALNMIDEAEKKKIEINISKLSELLNTQIIPTNARTHQGINELKKQILNINISSSVFYDKNILPENFNNYSNWINYVLQSDKHSEIIEKDLNYKNQLVQYIASRCVSQKNFIQKNKIKIDYYLTHKIYGFVFLLLTLLLVFQMVFFIAEFPMEWIESSMNFFSEKLQSILPPTQWTDLIINGIVPGITGVVMFIPQIALLFLMIGILEESGYMARISFLMDSIFSRFGLSGKSLIPLVSGVACAVPSILSTRTITNTKEKLITILVLPFMSCSARLPVYTLLISLIFPENQYYGFFNIKGLALLGLYLLGMIMALIYAFLFHRFIQPQKKNFFFIELPSYKIPYWKNLIFIVWNKVKVFVGDAGKIILAVSIILWYLSSHSFPDVEKKLYEKYSVLQKQVANTDSLNVLYKTELLENSYAGKLGKTIEPLIHPLGYDWKIGIALVTSFAAREVFVGTMATLYSANDDDVSTLRERIQSAKYPDTHQPVFTLATNVSLLIYYALAMQCISTMVIVYRELRSVKWVIIQFLIMTGTAYLLAFISYSLI